MPPRTSTTAHEGFSRSKFSEAYPIPGTAWGQGGVANVQFAGVPLSAVLKKQNVKIDREVKLPTKRQDLVRISHTPFCGESRRRARVGFPPALASRHFWIGVAGLNRLQRAFEIAGTIFLVVSRLISRTAPHCLWCGLRRQVLLEIEMFGFSNAGSPRPAGRVPAKDN